MGTQGTKPSPSQPTGAAGFFALCFSAEVWPRALKLALLVGTLLALINHGPALWQGSFAMSNGVQVLLSYFVPYAVSSYSAVKALQASQL